MLYAFRYCSCLKRGGKIRAPRSFHWRHCFGSCSVLRCFSLSCVCIANTSDDIGGRNFKYFAWEPNSGSTPAKPPAAPNCQRLHDERRCTRSRSCRERTPCRSVRRISATRTAADVVKPKTTAHRFIVLRGGIAKALPQPPDEGATRRGRVLAIEGRYDGLGKRRAFLGRPLRHKRPPGRPRKVIPRAIAWSSKPMRRPTCRRQHVPHHCALANSELR